MTQIEPIVFPTIGTATLLNVTVLNFETNATTCTTYYELWSENEDGTPAAKLIDGNYTMTPEEFAAWGTDNFYVVEVVANAKGFVIVA
jgi:hypothetical protein